VRGTHRIFWEILGLRSILSRPLCPLAAALILASGVVAGAANAQTAAARDPEVVAAATGTVSNGDGATDEMPWGEAARDSPAVAAPSVVRLGAIEEAWRIPAATLENRVAETRRAALGVGVWNLDPAARAIALGTGVEAGPVERARAAVRLAPDLPAPRMDLARAIWLYEDSPISAVRAVGGSLGAAARHLEASLWIAGCALFVLAVALIGGAALSILTAAGFALPHAGHDLGDLVSSKMPGFARLGLLAVVLLTPLVVGEGPFGLALALFAFAVAYGSRRQRIVMTLAAASLIAGAYPAARWAGAVIGGFPMDPVAESAYAVAGGSSLPSHIRRLEANTDDPLTARALARQARRNGNLGVADARYQKLWQADPTDFVVANNAANVRLGLGHMEAALELYDDALLLNESPVVLYNLAQAYGRAFQVENLAITLEHAQALDGELLAELTELQGVDPVGFVVDLPLSGRAMWRRVEASGGNDRLASELRGWIAPGWLGRDPGIAAGAFVAVGLAALLLGGRYRRSSWCPRCGRRVCPRCDPDHSGGDLCTACNRLFYQPETTDRAMRLERVTTLRQRERRVERLAWMSSLAVPGVAGLLADRPLRSLFACLAFALCVCALVWRDGVVPDPLVVGAAGPVFFVAVAALSAMTYAVLVALSLTTRRRE
jgi:tetratricopeptide (TPR) repeat protein